MVRLDRIGDALVAAKHMDKLKEGIMFGSLKSLFKAQLRVIGGAPIKQKGKHICSEDMLLSGALDVYMLIQQRSIAREK